MAKNPLHYYYMYHINLTSITLKLQLLLTFTCIILPIAMVKQYYKTITNITFISVINKVTCVLHRKYFSSQI